jgi:hypothetical protein
MPRILFWVLPLLLLTEGHMSGVASYLTLEQITNRSDAVILARKIEPHVVHREEPLGGESGRSFTFTSYRFAVQSVIHSRLGKDVPLDILEVQDASDEDNFRNEKRFFEGRPTKVLIYESYRPRTEEVDSLPEVLIFVQYNKTNKRFTFVARDAMEGPSLVPQVRKILSPSPDSPPR